MHVVLYDDMHFQVVLHVIERHAVSGGCARRSAIERHAFSTVNASRSKIRHTFQLKMCVVL